MIDTSPSLFVHNHRTVDGSTIRYQTASICSPKNIDHGCHTLLDSEAPPTCCWKSLCWRPHNGRIEVFFRPSLTVLLLSGLLPMVILFFFFLMFTCWPTTAVTFFKAVYAASASAFWRPIEAILFAYARICFSPLDTVRYPHAAHLA